LDRRIELRGPGRSKKKKLFWPLFAVMNTDTSLRAVRWRRVGLLLLLSFCSLVAEATPALAPAGEAEDAGKTVFGIEGTHFTLNGKRTFMLGFSYYGALGASEDFIGQDLDAFQRRGFNWLRVWATWSSHGRDVSAVDVKGEAREPFLGKLQWLLAECDRRKMVVDVTLTRGEARSKAEPGRLPNFAAHQQAVSTLVNALKPYRNWYLDLANEHDVRDARFVSTEELRKLREQVRRLDPDLLVTASFGGHDLNREDLREVLQRVGVDFVAPHRPRDAGSPKQTEVMTRTCLARMRELGRNVPINYQEPFRRGYGRWNPVAEDFLTDLRGAMAGGAAAWCFHNGQTSGAEDEQPRRSFDLHARRLFEQLDEEEREVVVGAGKVLPQLRGEGRTDNLLFLQ
jgi:hypothetical protein